MYTHKKPAPAARGRQSIALFRASVLKIKSEIDIAFRRGCEMAGDSGVFSGARGFIFQEETFSCLLVAGEGGFRVRRERECKTIRVLSHAVPGIGWKGVCLVFIETVDRQLLYGSEIVLRGECKRPDQGEQRQQERHFHGSDSFCC